MISVRRQVPALVFVTLLLVSAAGAPFLGASAVQDCRVDVIGPDSSIENRPIIYRASPSSYQSYSWDVSGGEISGPRNTASIIVVNTAAGTSSRATVTIRQGNCQKSNFKITSIKPHAMFCPTFSLHGPDSAEEGTPITIVMNYSSSDTAASPSFNWTISAGTITSGQGTTEIKVDTTDLAGQSVTATVELGGLHPSCQRMTSFTILIVTPQARKIDVFAGIPLRQERSRLKVYSRYLQNAPGAQGYLVIYGNPRGIEVRRRLRRVRSYLVNSLHVKGARLVVQHVETTLPPAVELWIVPKGAKPPAVTLER